MNTELAWSNTEELVAKAAFDKAYEREISALIQEVRHRATTIDQMNDVWQLHDFLSARRHDVDGKYDYRSSVLLFVLAQLVKEGWLKLEELEGLERSKIAKISALTRM